MALCLCAIFLYIPAMTYPMMEITKVGVNVSSTIIEGIISFLEFENYFIALVIFVASVVIPLVKLFGLFIIFLTLSFKSKIDNTTKIKIYNYIKVIGKWSMVDIYVVALMASLIQLDEVFNIKAGIASMSFTLVVILTMIAAQKFDKRIIWDE
jgi:paraquat-inducible protein A